MKRLISLFVVVWLVGGLCADEPENHYPLPDCYLTTAEVWEALENYQAMYPDLVHFKAVGFSQRDHQPLYLLKISDNVMEDENEPEIVYCGPHHAEEPLAVEIVMGIADSLLNGYAANDPTITNWVENCEILILCDLNPDSHDEVLAGQWAFKRKNGYDSNHNGIYEIHEDGVDINRQYDHYWDLTPAYPPSHENYKGEAPFTMLEIVSWRDYLLQERPQMIIYYHSATSGNINERIYYPGKWSLGNNNYLYGPDYDESENIAHELSNRLPKDYEAGNYRWQQTYGTSRESRARDWTYLYCGTLAWLIEVGGRYQTEEGYYVGIVRPGPEMHDVVVNKNINAAFYLLERSLKAGFSGDVYNSVTNQPLPAEITIVENDHEMLEPRICDENGHFFRYLEAGTYTVRVEMPGFETVTLTGQLISNTSLTELDIPMTPTNHQDLAVELVNDEALFFFNADTLRAEWLVKNVGSVDVTAYDLNIEVLRDGNSIYTETLNGTNIAVADSQAFAWAYEITDEGLYEIQGTLAATDYEADNNLASLIAIRKSQEADLDTLSYVGLNNEYEDMCILINNLAVAQKFHLENLPQYSCIEGFFAEVTHTKNESPVTLDLQILDNEANILFQTAFTVAVGMNTFTFPDSTALPTEFTVVLNNPNAESVTFAASETSTSHSFAYHNSGWAKMNKDVVCGITVSRSLTPAENAVAAFQPHVYELQNYPNPFNPETEIQFSLLNHQAHCELTVYNVKGQVVKRLLNEELRSGMHKVKWNGRNEDDEDVASGIYLYRLTVNGETAALKKMALLK